MMFETKLIRFLGIVLLLASCGKNHKTSSNTTTDTTVASSTSLAITYPEGMAVSSTSTVAPTSSASDPKTVTYATGSLAIPTSLTLGTNDETTYDPTKVPPKDKIIAAAKRLKGESDDCLPPYLFNPAPPLNINCYNPDGDMSKVFRDYTNASSPADPQFATASGLTSPGGEACLAAYSRAKIADVAAAVDQAQALVEGMICAAYKHDKNTKLPKVNATLDLGAILADITGGQKLPPNSDLSSPTGAPPPVNSGPPPRANFRFMKAEIKRLANEDTRAKFLTEIAMEVNGEVREIRLVHLPSLTTGNNDYVGRLSIRRFKVQRDGLTSNKELYTDINYMMDLDTEDGGKPKTRYRLYHARYSRAALQTLKIDPFAGIGQLDLNRGASFDGASTTPGFGKFPTDTANLNQTIEQIEQIDYAGNPITNEGLLAYWKNFGGNYKEAARGLVADRRRESADSTRLVGCAVSGAALGTSPGDTRSIRMAQREKFLLVPSGYYHPQGDPNTQPKTDPKCQAGDCQHAPFVYKQCYRQDDAGLYRPSGNQNTTANFDVINVLTSPAVVKDRLPPVDGKLRSP
jgi:hypothetical protein